MSSDEVTPGDGSDARDLLAAYALDAVDDVERRAVERLVRHDADAARELAELRATAAVLGSAAATPAPRALRADVLAQVRATPQAQAPTARTDPPPAVPPTARSTTPAADPSAPAPPASLAERRRRRSTTWLAVAATALAAAAVPTALAVQQAQQMQRVQEQAQAVADLLADPDAQVVRAAVEGGGTAVGVVTDDRALFTATGLAEPEEGRAYQLWLVREGAALPAGVLQDEDGTVQVLTEEYRAGDVLAVTVEPEAGSPAPTTEPVVVLAVEA